MFGRRKKQKTEEKDEDEIQIADPYDDEPEEWNQLSDADRARAWYDLEALVANSAIPINVPADQEPFSVYYDEAHRGNRCAEYALGKMYLTGTLTQQNNFQAGLWFSQVSDQGSPVASYELAKMMNLGIGFGKDPVSAEQLYRKSYQTLLEIESRSPNPAVEKKLAVICENGLCPDVDSSAAGRWRQLAQSVPPSVQMDAPVTKTGCESIDQMRVQKEEGKLAIPETFNDESASDFDEKTDETEPGAGLASTLKTEAVDTEIGLASNVRDIPVKYIFPSENNPYSTNDTDEAINALATSIQINGLLNPLVLQKLSDEEYRIISGEKRYKAITKYLGWSTIPATIKENLSSNAAQLMLHAANLDVREYTSAQKLQFYIDAKKLMQRMKKSGEYTGPIQKGIAEYLGMSEHQIRKYQKIVESLPKRQLTKFKRGEMSLEKAYKLARAAPTKKENTGRASSPKPDVPESSERPVTIEQDCAEPASVLKEQPDAMEPESGCGSYPQMDAPESSERPVPAEQDSVEPASVLKEQPDAMGPESGSEFSPQMDAPEFSERSVTAGQDSVEPASVLKKQPDAMEPDSGHASVPESDAVELKIEHASKYKDPETYQESISLLERLPTAPGDSCVVRNGDEISIGEVDRMEVYQNALLISVLIDGVRRPYPVSLIGTDLFLGPDCYRLAGKDQDASSF